jgi:HpcH/HpaI aldolase/citrate lyase family
VATAARHRKDSLQVRVKITPSPEFALWTDDTELASVAIAHGVDYVGPDLEQIDKRLRQPDAANLVSTHRVECLGALAEIVPTNRCFVRCNVPHIALAGEIDALIAKGVRCIMLPMVRELAQVHKAIEQIRGRARLIVMIEHVDALNELDTLATLESIHAFYIGTNDLSRSMGCRTRFGTIADGTLAHVARTLREKHRRFGFLGLARGDDERATPLPISPLLSMNAMVHLGAALFLFARSFDAEATSFAERFERTKQLLATIVAQDEVLLEQNCTRFIAQCAEAERAAHH